MRRLSEVGSKLRSLEVPVMVALGVVLVMAPNLISELPDRDSGVFLYVGSVVLKGGIPYKDVWDHKGPLIYLINALAAALSPRREVGIWALEAICISFAGYGAYRLVWRGIGKHPARLSVILLFGSLGYVLYPGNYTEEFALPLQVATLLQFCKSIERTADRRGWFVIGLLGGAVFLLRPNLVGLHLSIVTFVLFSRFSSGEFRRAVAELSYLGIGFAAMIGPFLAYFVAHDALDEMLDSVIRFNFVYLQPTLKARVDAVIEGHRLLAPTGLVFFSVSAWFAAAILLARRTGRPRENPLVGLAILGLPAEYGMVGLAGRSMNHYFISWLPISVVLAARFFEQILQATQGHSLSSRSGGEARKAWVVGIAAVTLILPLRRLMPPFLYLLRNGPRDTSAISAGLSRYDEQYLLMWGAETTFNYLAGKPSPSRFVYQYPLYQCGYVTVEMVESFREDIVSKRPLIVDTSPANSLVPPIDFNKRQSWTESAENCALTAPMLELLDYIDRNYAPVERMVYTGWPIYRYMGP